jgi:hypothetical protein
LIVSLFKHLGDMNSLLQNETSPAIPLVSKVPTIILGMDVYHGSPGHYDIPSIDVVNIPFVISLKVVLATSKTAKFYCNICLVSYQSK